MYRRETILARNISIEVTLRRSFSEIAATNRDPSRGTTLDSIHQLVPASYRAELQR